MATISIIKKENDWMAPSGTDWPLKKKKSINHNLWPKKMVCRHVCIEWGFHDETILLFRRTGDEKKRKKKDYDLVIMP